MSKETKGSYQSINDDGFNPNSSYLPSYGDEVVYLTDDYEKKGKSSAWRAGFNMTKSFIGAASFELPWALMQAGLWGGIIGLILLAFVANYTIKLLSACRKMTKNPEKTDYLDVGYESAGMTGKVLVYIGVISMNLGVCSSYVGFIASNLSAVLVALTDNDFFGPIVCILFVFPVLLCLSMIRSYHFLLYTSVPGCLALLFSMLVSYIYFFSEYQMEPILSYPAIHIESYPLFFGNAAFLFCIHSVVIPIEQSMQNPSRFSLVANISVIFVTILNLFFAVICYMLLGYCTQGNVIVNLPEGWLPIVVQLLLCLDILFTYTIFMIPLAEMIENLLSITPRSNLFVVKYGISRSVLVIITVCFALLVPDFNLITNLVGGFSNNLVAIILPPLFYILLRRQKPTPIKMWEYLLNGTVVVVGILAGAATTVTTILQIFDIQISVGVVFASGDSASCIPSNYLNDYLNPWQ